MDGAVTLTHMTASQGMIALRSVDMIDIDAPLNKQAFQDILTHGHSRYPVYERMKHNIRGYVLVKDFVVFDHDSGLTIKKIPKEKAVMKPMVCVSEDIKMLELLNEFQRHRKHIALVANDPAAVLNAWAKDEEIPPDVHMAGIITLEDIMEKLLQEEIDDEHDDLKAQASNKNHPIVPASPERSPANQPNIRKSAPPGDTPGRQKSGALLPHAIKIHKAETRGALGEPLIKKD